jgi:hypothetical protein
VKETTEGRRRRLRRELRALLEPERIVRILEVRATGRQFSDKTIEVEIIARVTAH